MDGTLLIARKQILSDCAGEYEQRNAVLRTVPLPKFAQAYLVEIDELFFIGQVRLLHDAHGLQTKKKPTSLSFHSFTSRDAK